MPLRERLIPREVIVWPVHQCGGAASTVLERLADGPLEAVVSKEQAIVKRLEAKTCGHEETGCRRPDLSTGGWRAAGRASAG